MAPTHPIVYATQMDGLLLERYEYEPGPPTDIATHVHETYQIGLALDDGGEYRYRGAVQRVPIGQLIMVHPGEPHSLRGRGPRLACARFLMMYMDPARLVDDANPSLPFFREPIADWTLVRTFRATFQRAHSRLDAEGRIALFLSRLGSRSESSRLGRSRSSASETGLERVREVLHDAPLADTSLAELAALADLSPHHLVRSFTQRYGLPPHRYRRQLRIEIAKRQLSAGDAVSKVAYATGFYDQSHFGHHFRRIVGTTPSRYRSAKS